MNRGPVTYLVVEFPGNEFKGEIMPALTELADAGLIHIMDMVVVKKGQDGSVQTIEMSSLSAGDVAALRGVNSSTVGVFGEEDIAALADTLDNNSAAGILLFENLWAAKFTNAIANANGRWLLLESVPGEIVDAALADSSAS